MSEAVPSFTVSALVCPACGATLHNASVALRKITCLNCGTKFVPSDAFKPETLAAPQAPAFPPETATIPETPKLGREPQACGYWMLRLSAMLYGTFTLLMSCVYVAFVLQDLGSFNSVSAWDALRLIGWLCLLPFSGWLAVMLTRALSRIEADSLRAGWRKGFITRLLPADPTSSLPYLGPFIIGGGILLIVSVVIMGRDIGSPSSKVTVEPLFLVVLAPVFCILLAFVLIDVRQFIFRQTQLAMAFKARQGPAEWSRALAWPLGGAAASILFLISLFPINELIDHPQWYGGWEDLWPGVYLVAFLWVCAYTFFLLGKGIAAAAQHWMQAAAWHPQLTDDPFALLTLTAVLAVATAALASAACYVFEGSDGLSDRFRLAFLGFSLQTAGAIFLFFLLVEVRRWRKAQQSFWSRRLAIRSMGLPGSLQIFLALGLSWLLMLELEGALQIGWQVTRSRSRISEYFVCANVAVYVLYLSLWIFALAREILLAEAAARAALNHTASEEHISQ